MTIESCDVHIKSTALDAKQAKQLQKNLERQLATLQTRLEKELELKDLNGNPIGKKDKQALNKLLKDPEEMAKMKDELFKSIKDQVEEGLVTKTKQVADLVRVQDLFEKFTTDPISGETLKSASDVIKNRLNQLVGRNSIDTRRRVLRNHFRNKIDDFEALFGADQNAKFKSIRDIKKGSDEEALLYTTVRDFKEQLDLDALTPEKAKAMVAGKGEIDRLAMSLVAYNEYVRKSMGKFGVSVKFNADYVMKRNYDWAPMEKMGPAQFAEYMVDKLDIKQTFGENATRESAIIILRDQTYDTFNAKATDRTSVLSGKDVIGDKANSKAVKFFYKDSQKAYDAFRDLSVGGMREQFERNAMSMAETAIQISEFGYNSREVTNQLNAKINDTYKHKRGLVDNWRESRIESAQTELAGQQHLIKGSLTNFSNNVRFMTAFTKLGTTLATTIADAVENNRQAFYVNGDFLGGLMDWSSTMAKTLAPKAMGGYSKAEMTEIANTFGVILSHQSNAEGMRMATGDLATNGGALTRLIQEHGGTALNIATLLPTQTGYSKIASAMTAVNNFSKLVDDFRSGNLNKFQKDTMKEYGFSQKDMEVLSTLVERTDSWGSRGIFTGGNIRKLLDHKGGPEFMAKQFGVQPETAGRAVLELATKFDSFINDFTTRGTPTPELATKTLLFKNTENQAIRTVINLTTQFMDTPMAMAENFADLSKKIKRINTLDGEFNKIGATKDMLGHLTIYAASGIPMYLAADAVMSAVTNSESMLQQAYHGDSAARLKVFNRALSRIGTVPYLAELIDNQWGGGYNKTALDTFGGPNLGTMRDTLRLLQSNDEGGMGFGEFARRHGPSNAIPVRGLNNWAKKVTGDKIWDDNKGTFL